MAKGAGCMLITFLLYFSQDSLTKAQQTDQAGPAVTAEEMRCYENDILPHKGPVVLVATHGYMSCPTETFYATPSHTLARAQLVHCLASDHSALSLCLGSSFYSDSMIVSKRIFAYLPPRSHSFCR